MNVEYEAACSLRSSHLEKSHMMERPSMTLSLTLCGLQVIGAFGEPIKGYGETTRRGRRQQVRYERYILVFIGRFGDLCVSVHQIHFWTFIK